MATMESLSATKARLEELKRVVEDKRLKKDEYALILSQQSNGSFFFLDKMTSFFLNKILK